MSTDTARWPHMVAWPIRGTREFYSDRLRELGPMGRGDTNKAEYIAAIVRRIDADPALTGRDREVLHRLAERKASNRGQVESMPKFPGEKSAKR